MSPNTVCRHERTRWTSKVKFPKSEGMASTPTPSECLLAYSLACLLASRIQAKEKTSSLYSEVVITCATRLANCKYHMHVSAMACAGCARVSVCLRVRVQIWHVQDSFNHSFTGGFLRVIEGTAKSRRRSVEGAWKTIISHTDMGGGIRSWLWTAKMYRRCFTRTRVCNETLD